MSLGRRFQRRLPTAPPMAATAESTDASRSASPPRRAHRDESTEARGKADERPRGARHRVSRRSQLLIVIVTVIGVVFTFVYPTRTWLEQRRTIRDARQELSTLERQRNDLQTTIDKLRSPEEIERIARDQYHLVLPGERSYSVSVDPPDTGSSGTGSSGTGSSGTGSADNGSSGTGSPGTDTSVVEAPVGP